MKKVTLGTQYLALHRLEEKGWINSRVGGITEKKGRSQKQYFDITKEGIIVMNEVKNMRNKLLDRLSQDKFNWLT